MKKAFCLLFILVLTIVAYSHNIEPKQDIAEISHLQGLQRKAHFDKDARLLVSIFSDDFTNISAGKIQRLSKEESISRFQQYFDRSTFIEWDNISPPITHISQDKSMAYSIVNKRVRLKAKNSDGIEQEETTIFAWLETYEKQNNKWVLTTITSTREPIVGAK